MSFLSVVVATYNRADILRTTLDHLGNQTLDRNNYEVIVVDDGSPDHTESMVRRYQEDADFQLKFLRHDNAGPGFTQNRGIREARGPWVLLIADDIHPLEKMLEEHYKAHAQHSEPHVAIAGMVVQSPDLPKTVFHKHWDPFRYSAFGDRDELSYINFWACNVSFKKDFMLEYGMFVERAGAAHEDTELGWRLYKKGGMRLLYCRDALAHHYHVENIDSACRRALERGRNFDMLADRIDDPGLYIRSHIVTRKTLRHFLGGFKHAEADILDEDRNVLWFLFRESIRGVLFNRITVPLLLMPMIRSAETNSLCARCMSRILMRGVNSYHFLKGLRELRRRRATDKSNMQAFPI